MSIPSRSAESSVHDRDSAARPGCHRDFDKADGLADAATAVWPNPRRQPQNVSTTLSPGLSKVLRAVPALEFRRQVMLGFAANLYIRTASRITVSRSPSGA